MTLHSSRPDARTDLLHGTLDMLILRTLQWGPQHGYAIGQTIRAQSSDVLAGGSRLSVPSPAAARQERLGDREMGSDRRQSARQVLSPHARRQETAASRGIAMDRTGERDQPGDATGHGAGNRGVAYVDPGLAQGAHAPAPGRRGFPGRDSRAPGHRRRREDGRRRRSTDCALCRAEGFRQRHADHRSRAPGLEPVVARRLARSGERRPLCNPRAREEPGLLRSRSSACSRSASA